MLIQNADQGGKFLARYLEQHMGLLVEEYLPSTTLADGTVIPVLPQALELGASEGVYDTVESFGQSGDDGGDFGDVALVDFTIGESRVPVYLIRKAVQYSEITLKRQALAASKGSRINVIDRSVKVAIQAIMQDANRIAAYGRGDGRGLINNPELTVTTNAFNPYSAVADATDVYSFITDPIVDVLERQEIESPETDEYATARLLLPSGLRRPLKQLKFPGTNASLENQIKLDFPQISDIRYTGLLSGRNLARYGATGVDTNDRMMFLPDSDMVLSRMVSEIYPSSPAWDGEHYKQVFYHAVTATNITYPGFIELIEFPNQ